MLLVMGVMLGVQAEDQLLINYPTSSDGLTAGSTNVSATPVKVNENQNEVAAYKFASSYVTNSKYNDNALVLTTDGGFKSGDVVTIAGAISNSDAAKRATVDLFTVDSEKNTTRLNRFSDFINGRLSPTNPAEESFTLTSDAETLYLGRNGDTAAFLTLIKVVRSKSAPVAIPAITFEAPAVERTITVGLAAAGTVKVDWGTGTPDSKEAAGAYDGWDNGLEFTGTPSGTVKIYGDGIIYFQAFTKYVGTATEITDGITAVNLDNATTLTELDLHQNNLTALDLSKLTALTSLNIGANDFTSINLESNTELTKVDLSNSKNTGVLASIDLSKNTKLTNVVLSGNKLTALDLSNNPLVKTLTVLNNGLESVTFGANTTSKHTLNLGGNKLKSLDLTGFTTYSGTYLRVRDNELSEIKLPGKISQIWADGNAFTLAQLYALKSQANTLTYATTFTKEQAQQPYEIPAVIAPGASVDLSSQALLGETATVFAWKKADGTALVEGTDYTVAAGVFTFLTAQEAIHCEMTNTELNAFTAENPYKTTEMAVGVEVPAITFEAPAVERTITVGLAAAGTVKVDWGTGTPDSKDAAGAYDGWDNALEFTGTPSGTVKIYADGIIYFQAFTKYANEATEITGGITAVNLDGAGATLTELDLHQNNLASVDLSKLTALTSLNIGVNDFTTIDLSANTELTSIDLSNGKNNGKLNALDLSNNTKLTKVVLSGNKLTALDLSNNPLVKTLTVLNNGLESVTFGANTTSKHTLNLGGNKLKSLDLTGFTTYSGTYLRVRDNELSEIKLPGKIGQIWADGNAFTLAQLYALKSQANTLTYSGNETKEFAQAPFAIAESINVNETVDLSSQALLGETATTFAWKKTDGTALVEGTDYTVAAGVFTFLTAQEAIHCEMTNAEFPLFTAEKPYITTTMEVKGSGTGISTIAADKANGAWYNLKGQRIDVPSKGLYIHNGKKVVVK